LTALGSEAHSTKGSTPQRRKTKIGDLHIIFSRIQQDVLWFKVTMDDRLRLAV